MVVGGRELIDTLWNVNHITPNSFCVYLRELIDTLWNVNSNPSMQASSKANELIDTLWNVNKNATTTAEYLQGRINRYIMECK